MSGLNRYYRRSHIAEKKCAASNLPLSLAEVCRKIGYDKGIIAKAFPEIRDQIASNYNDYQKQICETRRNKLEKEIKSEIQELEEQGVFVSAGRIAKFLNKSSYTGRRDVAQIIIDTRKMRKTVKRLNKWYLAFFFAMARLHVF